MGAINEGLQEQAAAIKQARDELRVEIHLAAAEIRDDWETLEREWSRFNEKLKRVGHEAEAAGTDVGEALSLLAEELKNGYARIRKEL